MDIHLPTDRSVEAWQLAIWNADEPFLSRTQKLVFMLIMDAGFNGFDPFRVVGDLLRNRQLWNGVVMERGYVEPRQGARPLPRLVCDLIALRDLPAGYWNVDTLFVTHTKEHTATLTQLAEGWSADEVGVENEETAGCLLGSCPTDQSILTVWWD